MTNKKERALEKHPFLKPYFKDDKDKWKEFKANQPYTWVNDSRYKGWVEQRKTQGFPNFELWSLDHSMIVLLAERVMAFTPYLETYVEATDKGQNQSIKSHKKLLELISMYLNGPDSDPELSTKIWVLWSDIEHRYWY